MLNKLRKPTIFLHVGAMKTGTTFLQSVLHGNRDALRDAGFLYPGDAHGDQAKAVRGLMGLTGKDATLAASVEGVWDDMVKEMRAWNGEASIFSMEFLSFVEKRRAAKIRRTIGRADLHVILTVRDATGMIPAQWQSYVRNHGTEGWPEFAHATMTAGSGGKTPPAKAFRRAQDIRRMVNAWGSVVPADHLHVITVPPSSAPRSLLWERFASVCGFDPEIASIDGVRSNPSLGYGSSELMRLVNPYLDDLRLGAYHKVSRYTGKNILSDLRDQESKPRLDVATAQFAAKWNARSARAIKKAGVPVVGDLSELPTKARLDLADEGPSPAPAPEAEVLAAARAVRKKMLRTLKKRGVPAPEGLWDGTGDDLAQAVAGAAAVMRAYGETI